VQLYHTPLKAEVLAQQFERFHYLTLNMGIPHHTTTITRFVDRFFRNTTPPLYNSRTFMKSNKNTLLKTPVSARKLRNYIPDASSPLPQSLHPPNAPFQPSPAVGILSHPLEGSQSRPIPKPNTPGTDPNSYRPINPLSTLGNFFERILAARLTFFVNRQHLLPHAQFGFRKKHSTVSQLARITNYISNGYNIHKYSGVVLLDL
jgi:hypothetical protein